MHDTQEPGSSVREDEWLVVRCQLGEAPAFDELAERWGRPLWRYVRRLANTDEAAEEIVYAGARPGAYKAAAVGLLMLAAALGLLVHAQRSFARLSERRDALERQLGRIPR